MIRDKIIIVEDDPGISKYLQAALRSHGYDILLAPDGKTALEMIASHCPDVLLLDEPIIRDVILFPLNGKAQDLMMQAPNFVTEKQLEELHIKIVPAEDKK